MKRRSFLKGILGVIGASVVPQIANAEVEIESESDYHTGDMWFDQKNEKTYILEDNWQELDDNWFVAQKTGMYDIRSEGNIRINGFLTYSPPVSGQVFYIVLLQNGDIVQCDKLYKYNYMKNN